MSGKLSLLTVRRPETKSGSAPEAEWLSNMRHQAERWLSEHGLPTRKEEAFRLLPLERLDEDAGASPLSCDGTDVTAEVDLGESAVELVIRDGVAGEVPALPVGIHARRLRDMLGEDAAMVRGFGSLRQVQDRFSAANTMGFTDGWVVEVDAGIELELPIRLRVISTAAGAGETVLPRLWFHVGQGSRIRLVEHHLGGDGAPLCCMVSELSLQPRSSLTHVRLAENSRGALSVAGAGVVVGENATYEAFLFGLGGRISRLDLEVRLQGEKARCSLFGLSMAGAKECVDVHTRVEHVSPRASTGEVFRAIAAGNGRVIFDGLIHVGEGASGTDARQESRSLLLSPEAVVNVIPQLTIDNDDVSCSHGATVGSLDPEQLMYLRSRGLELKLAREILVRSFASAAVEGCFMGQIRERVERHVTKLMESSSKELS